MKNYKTNYFLLLLVTIVASFVTHMLLRELYSYNLNTNTETVKGSGESLYKSLQVGQTTVLYPKDTKEEGFKLIKEIVNSNYSNQRYVGINWTQINLDQNEYSDAILMIYSDLGEVAKDKKYINTDPEKLLSTNDFKPIPALKACAYVVLNNKNNYRINSDKCFDQYKDVDDSFYSGHFNYGDSNTNVGFIDFNDDGVPDIIRIGLTTNEDVNGDHQKISAVFQALTSNYGLAYLEIVDKNGSELTHYEEVGSEEVESAMFGTGYDNAYNVGLYKYNGNGFIYIKNDDFAHPDEPELSGASCSVTSWKWTGGSVFKYDEKESDRKTKIECD